MPDRELVSGNRQAEDLQFEAGLRPRRLADFTGQYGAYRFDHFGTATDFDVTKNGDRLQIRKAGGRAGGVRGMLMSLPANVVGSEKTGNGHESTQTVGCN